MNNFTFGDAGMGYYETIAGGAGAGPGWNGRSGVHTHMTNTRITGKQLPVVKFCLFVTLFMRVPLDPTKITSVRSMWKLEGNHSESLGRSASGNLFVLIQSKVVVPCEL